MSNLHSKQTGTQLHKPQKFAEAIPNSILTKLNDSDEVRYIGKKFTIATTLECTADTSSSLQNKYFYLYSQFNTKKVKFCFNVGGLGTTPTLVEGEDYIQQIIISENATSSNVREAVQAAITSANNNIGGTHKLYKTIAGATDTITLTQECSTAPIVGDTGFTFVSVTTRETEDYILCTKAGADELEFTPLAEKIADVVGAMVSGNTETNITVTYDDADNTLDFAATGGGSALTIKEEGTALSTAATSLNFTGNGVVASGTGADKTITIIDTVGVNQVRLNDGSSSGTSVDGNVVLTIAGGTGITSAVSGTTITISETVEKKSKADVETLLGVSTTTLGTFTGSTIADSRDIKTALQDVETAHEVAAGKSFHHKSLRYSANNLDGTSHTSGGNNAWAFAEPNNNAHNRFFTAVDTAAMSYQLGGKSCIALPITGVSSKLVGGTLMGSGENGTTFKITIYKGDFDATATNMPMTLMGTFTVVGTGNTNTDVFNIVLGTTAACTLADGDGVIILMEDIESNSDMDVRGTVTLRFEDSF
jgi:hypothetical protein